MRFDGLSGKYEMADADLLWKPRAMFRAFRLLSFANSFRNLCGPTRPGFPCFKGDPAEFASLMDFPSMNSIVPFQSPKRLLAALRSQHFEQSPQPFLAKNLTSNQLHVHEESSMSLHATVNALPT
tara:strand:+ start:212 stop:586 length:375 start_codon:yes stop_codon:yes gene_type:complete